MERGGRHDLLLPSSPSSTSSWPFCPLPFPPRTWSSSTNKHLRRPEPQAPPPHPQRYDGNRWGTPELGNGKEEASNSTPPSVNDQLRRNGSHKAPRLLSHAAVRLETAADQESPSTPSTSASPSHT